MERILIPTDFSDVSKNALKFAIKIAHTQRSQIVLLHAVSPVPTPADTSGTIQAAEMERMMELASEKMSNWISFVEEHHVSVVSWIKPGLLMDVLSEYNRAYRVDLLITGMHEVHGIERWLGTNSMTMFRDVKCPVLIIPSEAKYHGIKKIVYATDLEYGDVKELSRVCELAQPFNASVVAVHVNTDTHRSGEEEENLLWFAEMVDQRMPHNKVSYRSLYNHDVMDGLSEAIEQWNADLLCMSTVKQNFLQRILHESKSRQMAYHSHLPLLLVHLEEHHPIHVIEEE